MSSSRPPSASSLTGTLFRLFLLGLAACQGAGETMTPGIRSEGTLAAGGTESLRFPCEEDQFLSLGVEQMGVDVAVALRGPDGSLIARTDGHFGAFGTERLLGIVPASGTCALEIESPRGGRYASWIEEQRAADETDRRRVDAARIYTEGARLDVEGKLEEAIAKYEDSLRRWTELGDRKWRSILHYALGQIHANKVGASSAPAADPAWILMSPRPDIPFRRYDPSVAVSHLSESSTLAEDMPELEASALLNLGDVYRDAYQFDLSCQSYERALPLWRRLGARFNEATTLNNLGLVYTELGELQKALGYLNDAIQIWRETGERYEEANSLHNRGRCYSALNRNEMALADYENALTIWDQTSGSDLMAASTMTELGSLLLKQNDQAGALAHLERAIALYASEPFLQAIAKMHLGKVHIARGDHDAARRLYDELLLVFRQSGYKKGEAIVLLKLGEIREAAEPDQALELFGRARELALALGSREVEASALYGMARAERARGRLDSSQSYIEEALDKVDSLRRRTTGLDLQSVYFAGKQDYYSFYIDLLTELADRQPGQGFLELALSASERSRARSLLDLLSASGVELGGSDHSDLLAREAELERSVEATYLRRERLSASRDVDAALVDAVTAELRERLLRLDDLKSEIRRQAPSYAEMTQPRPIAAGDIQADILDDDTLLLEYHLGEPNSYLFAATKSDLWCFRLSRGAELRAKVQNLHEILADAPEKITLNRGRLNVALAGLSEELLSPAKAVLGKKRLLVVAHDALQHVPFSALPVPAGLGEADDDSRLVDSHEIVFLPSTWTLGILRDRFADRRPASRKIAVLADPVFFDDPRLPASASRAGAPGRRASDPERHLGRLVYSRREAERILEQVGGGESMMVTGFDATKEAALAEELRDYRFIHFATHSIVDTEFPEMSSLVFSRVDRAGNEIDGFLRVYDVYKLDLRADMVVLSACRTGGGKEIRGEGLVGWTYGFMFSGAKSVLVSLWDVDDEATSELMGLFYSNVFRDGLPPSLALRKAQIEIRERPRWRTPYYWAGFLIQGEFI